MFFSTVAFQPVRLGKIYRLHYRGCLAIKVEEEVAARPYSKNTHNKVFARVNVCVCWSISIRLSSRGPTEILDLKVRDLLEGEGIFARFHFFERLLDKVLGLILE